MADPAMLPSVQPVSGGGHGNHGAAAGPVATGGGTSFTNALTQAMGATAAAVPYPAQSGGVAMPFSGESHPGHIPLAASAHAGGHQFQEVALGIRAYRQQLIASNIANADTPGYKAVDIDFQEALRMAQSAAQRQPVALATTAAGHIAGQAPPSLPSYPLLYREPLQASVDGNTVDMDVERAKFAENTLMYEFSLARVSNHYKMMDELFQKLTP